MFPQEDNKKKEEKMRRNRRRRRNWKRRTRKEAEKGEDGVNAKGSISYYGLPTVGSNRWLFKKYLRLSLRVVLGSILNTAPITTNYATFPHLGKSQCQYIQNVTNEPRLGKATFVSVASPLQGKLTSEFCTMIYLAIPCLIKVAGDKGHIDV